MRERFPNLPVILVVDKRKKYSEADIAIIKQADGCVCHEELFGQVDIIDDLVRLSRKRFRTDATTTDCCFKLSKAISLIRGGSSFDKQREVLTLLGEIELRPVGERPATDKEVHGCEVGHRPVQIDAHGEDPHVLVGASAGARGGL